MILPLVLICVGIWACAAPFIDLEGIDRERGIHMIILGTTMMTVGFIAVKARYSEDKK